MLQSVQPLVNTDYGELKDVIVCPPEQMEIEVAINRVQEKYAEENINQKLAIDQHKAFVEAMEKENVNVHHISPSVSLPEQVYTRDLGAVIENKIVVGSMQRKVRKRETAVFKEWLDQQQFRYEQPDVSSLEGGDILLTSESIYLGESGRTNQDAAMEMAKWFPDRKVEIVPIDPEYLHLDCVCHVISEGTALIYDAALPKKWRDEFRFRYRCIPVSTEEQFTLGVNVLPLGNKKVISLPENEKVNHELEKLGFHVIHVEFSEIIKSGGAFRCVTFPLVRL